MQDNRERTTNWRFAVLRGRQGFETLRPRWQALVDRLPHATYLQQPGWIAAYLDALATDDTIRFVTASRGDTLCGVLVLTRKAGGLKGWLVPEVQMISGPHMVLADLVADRDDTALWPAMLDWLAHQRSMRWLVMHLPVVCADSTLGRAMRHYRDRQAMQSSRTNSAWLDCSDGLEHALRDVSKSFRQNLKRLTRRAQGMGALEYRMVTRPEELERALEQFLTVESSGWKKDTGTAIALDERLVGFYRALVREFGPRGMCRINVLTLDDQAIAAQFGLISDRQLNLLKIGYSHEHGSVAPGNLIMRDTIEQVCADPALDRLSFVTHPPWSHLWKPQLAPVDYVTLFPETLSGRLTYAAATWLQARRARAAAAAAAADPAGDATAPASDDGGGADMLSGGGHATATGLSPT